MVTGANGLGAYFDEFRKHIIGIHQEFDFPFGRHRILYADWTAAGRAYGPIEKRLQEEILPFFANTHTETTVTGTRMSRAYEQAKQTIKRHVRASGEDVLLFCGSGMTGAVNKLQRILGLRIPERWRDYGYCGEPEEEARPLVLVTHLEHHSNHVSWLETMATVEVIRPDAYGNVDLAHLRELLEQYRHRRVKIAAVSACSNVTGIETPYHAIACLMHVFDGFCFVDFACSAPYVAIDMHPDAIMDGPGERGAPGLADLDAIYFSCHKFLGGPGTPGVLVFNSKMYRNRIPDNPGGGTLLYSNPWKVREYISDIEQREDGGTPPILQGIKAGYCIGLKEEMGVERIRLREEELIRLVFDRLERVEGIDILEGGNRRRLGVISFMVKGAHYNLVVRILNDRFGIQTRGGCSCAGTYGHYLLGIERDASYQILDRLHSGDMRYKPGWVRLSLHPTMTDEEVGYILDAIEVTVAMYDRWRQDYRYDPGCNEYYFNETSHIPV